MNFKKYTIMSFFSGVGGIENGFENTKRFKTIWANEIDKYAAITYKHNFKNKLIVGDIRKIDKKRIPNADVLIGGFPCQAFSIAGYRKGFEDDRGNLFFEIVKVVRHKKPRVIFLENVKNLVGHDSGNTFKVIKETLEFYNYTVYSKVMNAKEYGNIPQNRERIYIVAFLRRSDAKNFRFPDKIELTKDIEAILSKKVSKKYYYTPSSTILYPEVFKSVTEINTAYQWRRTYIRKNKSGVFPTLTANMGMGGHNVPIVKINSKIRKITPRECFRLQGYGEDFILPDISDAQLYKQAGNSVVISVIERIAIEIYRSLCKSESRK